MASKRICWTELVTSTETRSLDIDTDKWRHEFGEEFNPKNIPDDALEEYMDATGTEAESIDYQVNNRNLCNIEVMDD